jgi:hypothetical protein
MTLKTTSFIVLTLALAGLAGGCSAVSGPAALVWGPLRGIRDRLHYSDECDEMMMGWRNLVYSQASWRNHRGQYVGHPYVHDFGEGFRAGYVDVASGNNGCPPAVPPRKYWSWRYQSPEGQAKVSAWFEGYAHGARAADEEGIGNWSQLQISYAIKAQYCDRCIGGEPGPMLVPTPNAPGALPNGPPPEVVPAMPQSELIIPGEAAIPRHKKRSAMHAPDPWRHLKTPGEMDFDLADPPGITFSLSDEFAEHKPAPALEDQVESRAAGWDKLAQRTPAHQLALTHYKGSR